MIHSMSCKIFKDFGELVSDERRKGDIDSDYKIIGYEIKNIGNSGYGRTSMNKSKHASTTFCDLKKYKKSLNTPYFKDAEQYNVVFEIQKRKKITTQNMPIQISAAILAYAKLRMLEFYYDFLNKFVDRTDMNMLYMDTDSCQMAITGESFEDVIKPEMNTTYDKEKLN